MKYGRADSFPLEIWSRIISSIPATDKKFRRTLGALSLTCWLFYHESKRVILRNIRVECGDVKKHDHKATGSVSLSGANGAVYSAAAVLRGRVLARTQDRDLIRTICICHSGYGVIGMGAPRGQTTVKRIVDCLIEYRRYVQSRTYEDVNVIFVGGKGMDWGTLSDISYGLHSTDNIIITWEILGMRLYWNDSLWFYSVVPDDHNYGLSTLYSRSLDSSKLPPAPIHSLYITPDELHDLPAALEAVQG
jgi:hypothetical protein